MKLINLARKLNDTKHSANEVLQYSSLHERTTQDFQKLTDFLQEVNLENHRVRLNLHIHMVRESTKEGDTVSRVIRWLCYIFGEPLCQETWVQIHAWTWILTIP